MKWFSRFKSAKKILGGFRFLLFWVVLIGLHSHVYADEPLHIGVILDDSISMLEKTLHRKGGNRSSVEAVRKIDILKEQMSEWIQSRLEKEDSIYLSGLIPRQMRDKEIHITEGMKYWDGDSRFVPYPPESMGKTTVVREYSRDAISGILETQMRFIYFPSELPAAVKEVVPYMDITPLGYSLYEVSRWLNGYLPKDKKPSLRLLAVTDGIDYFGAENTCENIRRIEQEKLLSKQQISLHLIYFLPSQADRMDDKDASTKARNSMIDEADRIEKNYLTTVLACTKEMRDWVRVDAIDEQSALKEAVDLEIFKTKTDPTKTEERTDEKGDSDPKNNVIEIDNEDIKDMEKIIEHKELSKDEFEKEIQDLDLKPIAGSTLNYLKNQNLFFTIAPDEETIEPDKEKELIFFSLRDTGADNFSLLPRATVSIPSLKYKWEDEYGRIRTEYRYTIFNDTPYLSIQGRNQAYEEKEIWINLVSFMQNDKIIDLTQQDQTTFVNIDPKTKSLNLLIRPNNLDEPWAHVQVAPGDYSYKYFFYSRGGEAYIELKIDEDAHPVVTELPPLPNEFGNLELAFPRFEFSAPDTYDFFDINFSYHVALDIKTKKWVKKDTFKRLLESIKTQGIAPRPDSTAYFMDSSEASSIRIPLQDNEELFQDYLIQFDKTKSISSDFLKYEQLIEIDKKADQSEPIKYQDYPETALLVGYSPRHFIIFQKSAEKNSLSVLVYGKGDHRKILIDIGDSTLSHIDFGLTDDKLILDLGFGGEKRRIVYNMKNLEKVEDVSQFSDVDLSDLRSGSNGSSLSVEAEFPDKDAAERELIPVGSMEIPNLNFHLNGGRRIETPVHAILDRYFYDIVPYADRHPELSDKLNSSIYSLDDDEDIPFRIKDLTDFDKKMLSGEAIAFHFYRLNDEHLKTKPYLLLYFNYGGKSYYGFLKRTYVGKFIIGNK